MNICKIGISGCLGRMGQELIKEIYLNSKTILSGCFEHPDNNYVGQPISLIINKFLNQDIEVPNLTIESNGEKTFKNSDVVIDFTTPQSTIQNVRLAELFKTPIVIGTTGLDKKDLKIIEDVSKTIPIVQSANMSIGVNLLLEITEKASKILNAESYDAEISDTHHRHKIDAPSGTALEIGNSIARGRSVSLEEKKILERTSKNVSRKTGDIGFSISRAGEITGEHTVSFVSDNDRIDLTHKAYNRSIFVKGALEAAKWIANQTPGKYSMKNVLGF